MTIVVLLLAVAALVAAVVVGTGQARENADQKAAANAEQELTSAFWPAGFKRVSASADSCDAAPPSICLSTTASSKDAAADLAARLSAPSFDEVPAKDAPSSYLIAGTLTRNGTAVAATVKPHVDAAKSTAKVTKYSGSDVVLSLKSDSAS